MTVGIIDVGTNALHLMIARAGRHGACHVLREEHALTRLGEGGLTRNRLTVAAQDRTLRVLRRYRTIVARCGVDRLTAVATSAVREAENGRAFIRAVRDRTGWPLRIISGREEARLIYLGVRALNRLAHPVLIVTIGGGSVQVLQGSGRRLHYRTSLPLGAARLAQRFIRHDPATRQELAALARFVQRRLIPAITAARRRSWRLALGSSEGIRQLLAAARHWRGGSQRAGEGRRLSISLAALRRFTRWLSVSSAAERRRLPGVDVKRQALALPTALVLLAWMDSCRLSTLTYAPGSLREGLAAERCAGPRRARQRVP